MYFRTKVSYWLSLAVIFSGNAAAWGQTDKSIKDAQTVAKSAGLKQYAKFSNNPAKPWLYGGDASLSFASTSLTNWSAGGEDQLTVAPAVNVFANYKKERWTYENYGTFAYGIQKNGLRKAVKSNDIINIVSKLGLQMSKKWFVTTSLLMRTQFSPGYTYSATDTVRVSDFLAPLNVFLSIGADYRPSDHFSFVFSPLMGKAVFARSSDMNVLSYAGLVTKEKDATGADVQVPHKHRYEMGGGLIVKATGNLWKNKIAYNSQLELFSNYSQNPENIDVTWWMTLKFLIYKNISADIRFDLLFDDDQQIKDPDGTLHGAKIQTKGYVGISLFYQFQF